MCAYATCLLNIVTCNWSRTAVVVGVEKCGWCKFLLSSVTFEKLATTQSLLKTKDLGNEHVKKILKIFFFFEAKYSPEKHFETFVLISAEL